MTRNEIEALVDYLRNRLNEAYDRADHYRDKLIEVRETYKEVKPLFEVLEIHYEDNGLTKRIANLKRIVEDFEQALGIERGGSVGGVGSRGNDSKGNEKAIPVPHDPQQERG